MKEKNELSEAKGVAQDLAETSLEVGASMLLDNLPELGMATASIIGNEAVSAAIQALTGGWVSRCRGPSFFRSKAFLSAKAF